MPGIRIPVVKRMAETARRKMEDRNV